MDKNSNIPDLNDADEVSIKDLILRVNRWWRFLVSKLTIILFAGILGAAVGLAYAIIKKPTYKAELSFALQDDKSGGGLNSALGLASQFGIDLGGGSSGGEFSGDNLLELMKSRSMVEQTLLTPVIYRGKKETLANRYISFNNLRDKWERKPELRNIQFAPGADRSRFSLTQDSLLGVFYKDLTKNNLTVNKVDKKLSIITLSVVSTNELFSKDFTEVLAKVVSDFYVQTKTEKSIKNVAILSRQTDSVRRALNGAISGVAESIDAAPNANPFQQTLHVPTQRRQVDVQANSAILSELVKNLEIAKMSLLQETPLIQIIDKPILPLEKETVSKIKGTLIGGVVMIFVMVFLLTIRKMFKAIMS